nr:DDE-type integrase/transposase/recombinase [Desulfosediminicola flagellatus]
MKKSSGGPKSGTTSDITYIWATEDWLYLAVVIDLYSRQVVGWPLKSRMTKDIVINALQMAIWRRRPSAGLIFHSDRGSQYCKVKTSYNRLTSSMGPVSENSERAIVGIIVMPKVSLGV